METFRPNPSDTAISDRLKVAFPSTSITLMAPLSKSSNRHVFKAEMDGALCAVKCIDGPDRTSAITTAKAEIAALDAKAVPGRFAVNRCLMAAPKEGLIVLSWVDGRKLHEVIATARGSERAAIFNQASACLDWVVTGRSQIASFAPNAWMERIRARTPPIPLQPEDTQLLARLVRTNQAHARRCRGQQVRRSICHGDFVGANILWADGQMTLVDIQGQAVLAVARDAARFLVWQAMWDPAGQSLNEMGLPSEDCAAFLRSGVLPTMDQTTALPFFVGEQLHGRFHESPGRPEMLDNLRQSITHFCDHSLSN